MGVRPEAAAIVRYHGLMPIRFLVVVAVALLAGAARAQVASPHAIDIPRWFSESFLDFGEDVRDAARDGKRVMLYFGQDGCPYCKALMKVNFGEPDIVEKTRARFVAVALNIWGDREVVWVDGRRMAEKELARTLRVQYTPTLLFLDEKGTVALRLNGYQPPERFRIALDYAGARPTPAESFTEYAARRTGAGRPGALAQQPFLEKGSDLARMLKAGKPLLVLFEQKGCPECAELHRDGFARAEVRRLLSRFTVVQLDVAGQRALVAPDGAVGNEREWARDLRVVYAPSLVFFDAAGKEVFRTEGYVRPFHLAAALDYVGSGGYRDEPSFQRYLQKRADAQRASGREVDLWK